MRRASCAAGNDVVERVELVARCAAAAAARRRATIAPVTARDATTPAAAVVERKRQHRSSRFLPVSLSLSLSLSLFEVRAVSFPPNAYRVKCFAVKPHPQMLGKWETPKLASHFEVDARFEQVRDNAQQPTLVR